ncbi:hypothetical protein [uncultured Rummeliibacillus sp.]|uniref:hypothetical protein n=1 Tax=uncultured Rummeliibacillus sp. TaxID=762292 RepID=UPI00260E0035|nr:hypothetical protein [uncultured Rummeliibacillus sp.]
MKNNILQNKLDSLVKLYLTTGVQPSDLADNIFLENYKQISFLKHNGLLVGEIVYEENYNGSLIDTKLRYFYKDKQVITIEEEFLDTKTIIWDRKETTSKLLQEIISILTSSYSAQEIDAFINSLPEDLSVELTNILQLTA